MSFSYVTAVDLIAQIRDRKLSPVELVTWTLDRIEQTNSQTGAYITVMADEALAAARAAEQAVMNGDELGPLHGLPVPIKDVEGVKGVRFTHGSVPADEIAQDDSLCVERIRAAGGIIIGKTNTPEFGHAGTTENLVFGPTRNPWDLKRTSGGSSGGAGASVAAGITAIAQGSDGGGSVRIPSSFCGIFGIKATQGRIPRRHAGDGSFNPVNHSSVGPMARTVADAVLLFNVIAGPAADAECDAIPDAPPDFTPALRRGVSGLRIALDTSLGGAPCEPSVAEAVRRSAKVFEELGAVVEEAEFSPEPHPVVERRFLDYFCARGYGLNGHLLDDPASAEKLTPYFRTNLERGRAMSARDYIRVMEATGKYRTFAASFFTRYDLLITPTLATTAFEIDHQPEIIGGARVSERLWGFTPFTYVFNLTGNPAASVPCGFDGDGMPIGMQIVGPLRDEMGVLAASAAFEEARPWADARPAFPPV